MIGRRRLFQISSVIFFLLFLILSPKAFSQVPPLLKLEAFQEPVRLRADRISYDQLENSYLAEGSVEIWQGDRKLSADRVYLNAKTNEVEATGNVVLVQGEDFLRSARMKINLDTHLGIILQGTLFLKKQNFYLRGEEIERLGEDTYRIREGSFTTCEGDRPAWRFTGRETLVTLEEYASVWGGTFQVKNIPLLYSPYLLFPVKTRRQSGFLIPQVGYSNNSGLEVNNAYFWAIAKNMDATFQLDLATQKGVGEGVEYRYIRKKESFGSFYGYHTREWDAYREKRTEQLDRKPDRWSVEWRHEEYFAPTFVAKAWLRGFSDRQFLKDYGQTYAEQSSEQAYSFISLTKNWERFSLFGEARHTVDLTREDKTTLQNYPLINFTGVKQQIFKTPFYYSFTSSYGYYWREEGMTGHRLDLYPRLSLPLKWADYIEITPEVGARETLYRTGNGSDDFHSRELWDFSTTLATNFYRVFETGSSKVPKLKHLVRPEVTYTYIPDIEQKQVPTYDTPIPKANTITYGLIQRLIGKVFEGTGRSRYHEFAYLKLSQTYDLHEAQRQLSFPMDERRAWGPVSAELRIKTLKYFSVENLTNYDPNKNLFLNHYTAVDVTDFRGDALKLEYTWENGVREQIHGNLRIKIIPSLDVSFGMRYSFFDQKTLETSFGLNYQHQCWGIDVSYTEKPEVAGQPAERKTMFMFTLTGVTTIGKR